MKPRSVEGARAAAPREARAPDAAATRACAVAAASGLAAFALAGLPLLWAPAGALDRATAAFVASLRSPELDRVAVLATMFGDADFLVWPMLATVATLVVMGRRALAADAAAAFLVAPLAVFALKLLIRRPRPPASFALTDTFAFPSGHATGGAVMLGALAALYLADRRRAGLAARALVWAVAALGALAIAASRVWLGAHWLTDTVAALGLALALVAWFAARVRAERAAAGPGSAEPLLGPWLVAGYALLWALHARARFAASVDLYAVTAG